MVKYILNLFLFTFSIGKLNKNLIHEVHPNEIPKFESHFPLFLLLVGQPFDSLFEKYKEAIHQIVIEHSLKKSWVYFGFLNTNLHRDFVQSHSIKKLPCILTFFEGQLIKKDYRFNVGLKAGTDMELKILRNILVNVKDEKDFLKEISSQSHVIIVNCQKDEEKHFITSSVQRTEYLKRISELISVLPYKEYRVIGIDFANKSFARYFNLSENNLILYSKSSTEYKILNYQELISYDLPELKNWIFHNSLENIVSPSIAFEKLMHHKNWGMFLFFDSKYYGDESSDYARKSFESVALKNKGKLMFSLCDVAVEEKCSKLIKIFELTGKKFPLLRVLYSVDGQKEHLKVFKRKQSDSQTESLINEPYIQGFVDDFLNFDIEIDSKVQPVEDKILALLTMDANELHNQIIEDVIPLNTVFKKTFKDKFRYKDRFVLIFDSSKDLEILKEFNQALEIIKRQLPMDDLRHIIFASYDVHLNTRYFDHKGLSETPLLRIFRKEDSFKSHYTDRKNIKDKVDILNTFVDLCDKDYLIEY